MACANCRNLLFIVLLLYLLCGINKIQMNVYCLLSNEYTGIFKNNDMALNRHKKVTNKNAAKLNVIYSFFK